MKNQFSKALICGVVASSVFLVNCQKSPSSRGVTPQKSVSGNTDKTTISAADIEKQSKVPCAAEIVDGRKSFDAVATKITDIISDKSDPKNIIAKDKSKIPASDQELLKQDVVELKEKSEALLASFKKASIGACLLGETKDGKSTGKVLKPDDITTAFANLASMVSKATGEATVQVSETATPSVSKEDLSGTNFNLDSKDLGDSLATLFKESSIYYVAGSLEKDLAGFDLAKADDDKSLCLVKSAAASAVEVNSLITVVSVVAGKDLGKKKSYDVSVTATGEKVFMLKCAIAVNKGLVAEFKAIFSGLLKYQTAEEVAKNQEALKAAAKEAIDAQEAAAAKAAEAKSKAEKPAAGTTAAPAAKTETKPAATSAAPVVSGTPAATEAEKKEADKKTADAAAEAAKKNAKTETPADAPVAKAGTPAVSPDLEGAPEQKALPADAKSEKVADAKATTAAPAAELAKIEAEMADVHAKLIASGAEAKADYDKLIEVNKNMMPFGKDNAKKKYALSNQVVLDGNILYKAMTAERNARLAKSDEKVIASAQAVVNDAKAAKAKSDAALAAYKKENASSSTTATAEDATATNGSAL